MVAATALLCLAAFTVFTLTRKIYILIKRYDKWRVEVHFTLCAIHFSKIAEGGKRNKKKKGKGGGERSLHHYREVVHRIMTVLPYSEIEINRIHLPANAPEFSEKSATRPIGYHSILLALTAFLKSKAKKLTIRDNAITLISDSDPLSVDITIKVRLFHAVRTLLAFTFGEKILKGHGKQRCRKIK